MVKESSARTLPILWSAEELESDGTLPLPDNPSLARHIIEAEPEGLFELAEVPTADKPLAAQTEITSSASANTLSVSHPR